MTGLASLLTLSLSQYTDTLRPHRFPPSTVDKASEDCRCFDGTNGVCVPGNQLCGAEASPLRRACGHVAA